MNLPKTYDPHQYESDIYALWEKTDAFKPKGEGETYSIVMPPPNANANAHLGHALTVVLEDVAVRYQRLQGKAALLLPGADHAGFETQSVYEKHLAKEGKSRFDFTREELYGQIFDFVALNRRNFESQLRRIGASCDWSRFTFTLDDKIVTQAYSTFKKMWDEGLIYRGERLVNYCTFHGTGFADIEVEYKEEKGHLWHIRYPLTDGSDELVVATTRPETLFGDMAVAVHPDDERYKKLVGKTVRLPLTNREIPVIADDFVDQSFGTGAVKITPAHDPNDFETGKRHDLAMPSIITHEGVMAADTPEAYRGLPALEARTVAVKELEDQGYLANTEPYTHNVGHCYKCGTIIQPLLLDQWFVDMQPLAQKAIEVLEAEEIAFYPTAKREQLISYLKNLHDWNISRQIAWGIPIPAFQNVNDADDWIYDERVTEEIITIDGKTYRRDPDVFDTWFSSSSWPYATLNLGDSGSSDFERFYPLSLMETGGEILYPWVSRMIMLGLYTTGKIPFEAVYIHGYVMAEDGSKMSKSVGNVIDPMPVIDKYGSDALRMGLIASRAPAVNRGYDPRKVEDARNFCNKLWNIARYIEDKTSHHHIDFADLELKSDADHWLMSKLQHSIRSIGGALDDYRFAEAYDMLYHFVWDDVADWYIEVSKTDQNPLLLAYALQNILIIAHPFAPFVTETIWQTLPWQKDSILATTQWPTALGYDDQKATAFGSVAELIGELRAMLKNLNLPTADLMYKNAEAIQNNAELIKRMAHIGALEESTEAGKGLQVTQTIFSCWLDISEETATQYKAKLKQQFEAELLAIKRLEGRLGNKSYTEQAPASIVAQTRQQLEESQKRLGTIEHELKRFK